MIVYNFVPLRGHQMLRVFSIPLYIYNKNQQHLSFILDL
jgi:hypothetical protein